MIFFIQKLNIYLWERTHILKFILSIYSKNEKESLHNGRFSWLPSLLHAILDLRINEIRLKKEEICSKSLLSIIDHNFIAFEITEFLCFLWPRMNLVPLSLICKCIPPPAFINRDVVTRLRQFRDEWTALDLPLPSSDYYFVKFTPPEASLYRKLKPDRTSEITLSFVEARRSRKKKGKDNKELWNIEN